MHVVRTPRFGHVTPGNHARLWCVQNDGCRPAPCGRAQSAPIERRAVALNEHRCQKPIEMVPPTVQEWRSRFASNVRLTPGALTSNAGNLP